MTDLQTASGNTIEDLDAETRYKIYKGLSTILHLMQQLQTPALLTARSLPNSTTIYYQELAKSTSHQQTKKHLKAKRIERLEKFAVTMPRLPPLSEERIQLICSTNVPDIIKKSDLAVKCVALALSPHYTFSSTVSRMEGIAMAIKKRTHKPNKEVSLMLNVFDLIYKLVTKIAQEATSDLSDFFNGRVLLAKRSVMDLSWFGANYVVPEDRSSAAYREALKHLDATRVGCYALWWLVRALGCQAPSVVDRARERLEMSPTSQFERKLFDSFVEMIQSSSQKTADWPLDVTDPQYDEPSIKPLMQGLKDHYEAYMEAKLQAYLKALKNANQRNELRNTLAAQKIMESFQDKRHDSEEQEYAEQISNAEFAARQSRRPNPVAPTPSKIRPQPGKRWQRSAHAAIDLSGLRAKQNGCEIYSETTAAENLRNMYRSRPANFKVKSSGMVVGTEEGSMHASIYFPTNGRGFHITKENRDGPNEHYYFDEHMNLRLVTRKLPNKSLLDITSSILTHEADPKIKAFAERVHDVLQKLRKP